MTKQHSQNSVAAKDRRRLHAPPPEYFDDPDYTQPVRRLLYEDLQTGAKHEFLLFISPHRIDQFRVLVNGKVWKERIGWSHVVAALRKAAGRFSRMRC